MDFLNLFGRSDRIKDLKIRLTDLEVEMNAVKKNIDNLFLEISQAKKKKTFVSKETEQTEEQYKPDSVILPEPNSQGIYKRK